MATRSHIGVRNTDGTIDYIYCHWDGYPEHVGKMLINHYQDMDKVNALMKLGDLSALGKEIGEKHDFDKIVYGWCRAYGRDREETGVSVSTTTFDNLLNIHAVDYVYIFDGEFWECYDTYYKTSINLYDQLDIEVNIK
jgi:hypothetical protein